MYKKIKLLTLGALFSFSIKAQSDTAFIQQQIRLTLDSVSTSFFNKDWAGFTEFMYPDLIKMIGTKEEFTSFIQEQMIELEVAKMDIMQSGNILQLIKEKGQWQCLVENYSQMHIDSLLVSGVSSYIGFSDSTGNVWKFIRVNTGSEETQREIFPIISNKFKIPYNKMEFGITLDELLQTYKPTYPKKIVKKKIIKKNKTTKKKR